MSTPAEKVFEAFGGARAVAALLGLNPATVYRWNRPKEARGSAGLVPQAHHRAIVELAHERGLNLEKSDLVDA